MKCEKWIIVIDGKKYAVDRCFSGYPAIYTAAGEAYPFYVLGHVNDKPGEPEELYWGEKNETDCVFILARKVKP